jgi:hypothetical protein
MTKRKMPTSSGPLKDSGEAEPDNVKLLFQTAPVIWAISAALLLVAWFTWENLRHP